MWIEFGAARKPSIRLSSARRSKQNTKSLHGAGARERTFRHRFVRLMRFIPHRTLPPY